MYAIRCRTFDVQNSKPTHARKHASFRDSSQDHHCRAGSDHVVRRNRTVNIRGSGHHVATKHAKPPRVNNMCWRCGNVNHTPDNCRFKSQTCHRCNKIGHVQKRCDAVRKWTTDYKKRSTTVHYVREAADDNVINHLTNATNARSTSQDAEVDSYGLVKKNLS